MKIELINTKKIQTRKNSRTCQEKPDLKHEPAGKKETKAKKMNVYLQVRRSSIPLRPTKIRETARRKAKELLLIARNVAVSRFRNISGDLLDRMLQNQTRKITEFYSKGTKGKQTKSIDRELDAAWQELTRQSARHWMILFELIKQSLQIVHKVEMTQFQMDIQGVDDINMGKLNGKINKLRKDLQYVDSVLKGPSQTLAAAAEEALGCVESASQGIREHFPPERQNYNTPEITSELQIIEKAQSNEAEQWSQINKLDETKEEKKLTDFYNLRKTMFTEARKSRKKKSILGTFLKTLLSK